MRRPAAGTADGRSSDAPTRRARAVARSAGPRRSARARRRHRVSRTCRRAGRRQRTASGARSPAPAGAGRSPPGDQQAARPQTVADVILPRVELIRSVNAFLEHLAYAVGQRPPPRQRHKLDSSPVSPAGVLVRHEARRAAVQDRLEQRSKRPVGLGHRVAVDRDRPVPGDVALGGVGVFENERFGRGEPRAVIEDRRVRRDSDGVAVLPTVEAVVGRREAHLRPDAVARREGADLVGKLARRAEVQHALVPCLSTPFGDE